MYEYTLEKKTIFLTKINYRKLSHQNLVKTTLRGLIALSKFRRKRNYLAERNFFKLTKKLNQIVIGKNR